MRVKRYHVSIGSLLFLTMLIVLQLPANQLFTTGNKVHEEIKEEISSFPKTDFLIENTIKEKDGTEISQVPNGTAEWIPFKAGASVGKPSRIVCKSSDTMGLLVDSDFYGMYNQSYYHEDSQTSYNILNVPNCGQAGWIGKPAVPVISCYLEIPHFDAADASDITVSVIYSDMTLMDNINVIPVQREPADYPNATLPEFSLDETTYSIDEFFPKNIASRSDQIIMRGHSIVHLSIHPVQFNPVTKQIRIYSKIEVRLGYPIPAQYEKVDRRLVSPAFEEFFKKAILNYRYRSDTLINPTKGGSIGGRNPGAEYLIITHDDFYDAMQSLANWKKQKGLVTKVVKTSAIKATPTADDIVDYIQDIYETWDPVPAYILLVGDAEFIPPMYHTTHPDRDSHGWGEIPTDLYYATVDGDDFYPEIFIGRISVDTDAQATTIVNKILKYEMNPPANAAFYDRVAAAAYFEDDDARDGFEDRRFVLTSEEIRNHLLTLGYNVNRIYNAEATVTPTNYNNGVYDAGMALPKDLLRANGFTWSGSTADITNVINNGVFLLYHRDHGISRNFWHHDGSYWGWIDGWGDPSYDTGDIAGLANGDLLPIVLSVECQTGWFDGETDQNNDNTLTRNFESFAETFLRQAGGGAIAVIASTRNSYSGYNDELVKGFTDAIWPGGFGPAATGGLYSLGQILTYGKVYMAKNWRRELIQETFELFHLHGDPEMQIITSEPGNLIVKYPATIGSGGQQQFVVSVNDSNTGDPISHAKVCLDGAGVYTASYTNPGGQVSFTINPSTGGEMNVTVTMHNYRPYIQEIAITANGASISIQPDDGPIGTLYQLYGNGFNGGEQVNIHFGGVTVDTTVTANSYGRFDIERRIPSGPLGLLNVIAIGQSSGKTAVDVFRRLPSRPLPDPFLYCQSDPSTYWMTNGELRWDNPSVYLTEPVTGNYKPSNQLFVGATYDLKALIFNNADVPAVDTVVTFEWAFWGSGQKNWNYIGSKTITVPPKPLVGNGGNTATVRWTPSVTGHTCLKISVYHLWDKNLANNEGQENTHVLGCCSPGEVNFTLQNPGTVDALIYLEAKQLSAIGGTDDIWGATIRREYPQIQGPGENKTVTFHIDVPDDAVINETHIFVVNAYLNYELIGGVEIVVVKEDRTTSSATSSSVNGVDWNSIYSIDALFIIAAVVVFRRQDKKK